MNRREFFQTSTLFLAGAVCVGTTLQSANPTFPFRAQKIFLESWDIENVWEDSLRTTSFVRKNLESLRRNACNGVLLVPSERGNSGLMNKIVLEANDFDLKVFVPACLTCEFFCNIRAVTPLAHRKGVIQSIDGRPIDKENGGFLLLDGIGDVFGIILYDSSRCLWSGFALPAGNFTHNTEADVNDSRLMAAKWLDRVLLRGV